MRGIVGIFNFGSLAPVRPAVPVRATAAMVHRGPDDEGFYVDGEVALGNRRLSIIDLPGGHQLISNEEGTIWSTFNREIYNYRDLRQDLEKRIAALASRPRELRAVAEAVESGESLRSCE